MIRVIPMRGMARPTTWNFATPASYQPLPSGGFAQQVSLSGLRRHHLRVCGQRQMGRPCGWNFDTPASYAQIPCAGGTYAQQVSLSGWRAGRRLRGLRGLGQDASECDFDSDCGPGGTCGAGVCYNAPQQVNDPTLGPTTEGSQGILQLPPGSLNAQGSVNTQSPSGTGRGIGAWLSQPVSPGWPSNGAVIGIAAGATALFSMLGRRGRR